MNVNATHQAKVARAWVTLQRNWWAYEKVSQTCERKPKQAWPLLQALLRIANTKELIQDFGAGPLEDFIRAHGEKYIDEIEALAAQSGRFRQALRIVLIRGLDVDLTERLIALGCRDIDALSKDRKRKAQPSTGANGGQARRRSV